MPEIPAPARARFLLGNTACFIGHEGTMSVRKAEWY